MSLTTLVPSNRYFYTQRLVQPGAELLTRPSRWGNFQVARPGLPVLGAFYFPRRTHRTDFVPYEFVNVYAGPRGCLRIHILPRFATPQQLQKSTLRAQQNTCGGIDGGGPPGGTHLYQHSDDMEYLGKHLPRLLFVIQPIWKRVISVR